MTEIDLLKISLERSFEDYFKKRATNKDNKFSPQWLDGFRKGLVEETLGKLIEHSEKFVNAIRSDLSEEEVDQKLNQAISFIEYGAKILKSLGLLDEDTSQESITMMNRLRQEAKEAIEKLRQGFDLAKNNSRYEVFLQDAAQKIRWITDFLKNVPETEYSPNALLPHKGIISLTNNPSI